MHSTKVITEIDHLFLFLNTKLREIRKQIFATEIPVLKPDQEGDGDLMEAKILGNHLDKFLRQCLLASSQMMFENIMHLFDNY